MLCFDSIWSVITIAIATVKTSLQFWPAGVVHAEDVDVPSNALGLHHLPEQLPGHVAPAEDHREVEGGLASEQETQVQTIRGQVPDLRTRASTDSHVESWQLPENGSSVSYFA